MTDKNKTLNLTDKELAVIQRALTYYVCDHDEYYSFVSSLSKVEELEKDTTKDRQLTFKDASPCLFQPCDYDGPVGRPHGITMKETVTRLSLCFVWPLIVVVNVLIAIVRYALRLEKGRV